MERLHQTALAAVLRNLDRRPDVDPALPALELRLRHWLFRTYNHTPHEGLEKVDGRFPTPYERWRRDTRRLSHATEEEIRSAFVLYQERSVGRDRTVSIDGVIYELPLSLAPGGRRARRIQIQQRVLDGTFHVLLPGGELVRIHPVDLVANARTRRAPRSPRAPSSTPTPSAADMVFERDLGGVLDDDQGSKEPANPDDEPDDESGDAPHERILA